MLVELLEPAGPDLARRWLAALLLVDREDRPALVAEIERRVVAAYAPRAGGGSADVVEPGEITVVSAPVQREGFVEQVITTYARQEEPEVKPSRAKRRSRA
ncbi:MAG: hypothetical protein GC200_12760 [Tepidisphaera sp.]|nr:hypothetical protein [Tepidisphaera sp.]